MSRLHTGVTKEHSSRMHVARFCGLGAVKGIWGVGYTLPTSLDTLPAGYPMHLENLPYGYPTPDTQYSTSPVEATSP